MVKWAQILVGVGISATLVALVLRVVDTSAVTTALRSADLRLVVVAIGWYLLAMGLRSVLWRRLLQASVPTRKLFQATIVGFAVSYVLPLRVGEFARGYLLARWCGIAYGTTAASLVAERVLDGTSVAGVLLVAMLFVPTPGYIVVLGLTVAALFGLLAILLVAASWHVDTVDRLGLRVARMLPLSVQGQVVTLTRGFARGLTPLRNWRLLPGLLGLCVAGWLCQFAVFYVILAALSVPASVPFALLAGSVSNFATLVPSAPGFVGTFDATLVKLLTDVQGVALERAAAYALIVHTVLVVPVVTLACVILWNADVSVADVLKRSVRPKAIAEPAVHAALLPTAD